MKAFLKVFRVTMIAKALLAAVLCVGCLPIDVGSAGDTVKTDFEISENEPVELTTPPPADETDATAVSQEDWSAFYTQTLHSYMFQDTALSEDIDYIAIDLSSLEYASAEDKESVADFFSSAYVPVIDADIERFKEEGLFDEDTMSLPNGVLLQVQSVSRYGEEIVIKGMKYRSGLGANGFETKWTANADGTWTMHETVMIWIS